MFNKKKISVRLIGRVGKDDRQTENESSLQIISVTATMKQYDPTLKHVCYPLEHMKNK